MEHSTVHVALSLICLSSVHIISSAANPELCDLRMWYLDLVTDGVFDGELSPEQQTIKERIEMLIARTKGTPHAGRISCSTISTFENILLPDRSARKDGRDDSSDGGGGGGGGGGVEDVRFQQTTEEGTDRRHTAEGSGSPEHKPFIHGREGNSLSPVKQNGSDEQRESEPKNSQRTDKDASSKQHDEQNTVYNDKKSSGKQHDGDTEEATLKHPGERSTDSDVPESSEDAGQRDSDDDDQTHDEIHEDILRETEGGDSSEDNANDGSGDDEHEFVSDGETGLDGTEFDDDDTYMDTVQFNSLDESSAEGHTDKNAEKDISERTTSILPFTCSKNSTKCSLHEHLFFFVPKTSHSSRNASLLNLWALCSGGASQTPCVHTTSAVCHLYHILQRKEPTIIEDPPSLGLMQESCRRQSVSCSLQCYYVSEKQQCIPHYRLPNHTKDTPTTGLRHHITSDTSSDEGETDQEESDASTAGIWERDNAADTIDVGENDRDDQDETSELSSSDINTLDKADNKESEKPGSDDDESENDSRDDADDVAETEDEVTARKDDTKELESDRKDNGDSRNSDTTEQDMAEDRVQVRDSADNRVQPSETKDSEQGSQREDKSADNHASTDNIQNKRDNHNRDSRTGSGLSEAELRNLEFLLQERAAEQATKIQALEITIMKLENHVLSQKLQEQGESTHLAHLENQILRLENELLKLNQSYAHLHAENELLKSRQNKYLALEHKSTGEGQLASGSGGPQNSSKYFELVSTQQERLTLLSDLLKNQSISLQLLQTRSDKLEEQNQMLHQIVMNQTALISHVMQKLQEVSEQNLQNRQETSQLKSIVQFQSASDTIINKLEHMLHETSPRAGSHVNNPHPKTEKFRHILKFFPGDMKLIADIQTWRCNGTFRTRLCLLNTALVSPCPPYRTFCWIKCSPFPTENQKQTDANVREGAGGDAVEEQVLVRVQSSNTNSGIRVSDSLKLDNHQTPHSSEIKDEFHEPIMKPGIETANEGIVKTNIENDEIAESEETSTKKYTQGTQTDDDSPPHESTASREVNGEGKNTQNVRAQDVSQHEAPDSVNIPGMNPDPQTRTEDRQQDKRETPSASHQHSDKTLPYAVDAFTSEAGGQHDSDASGETPQHPKQRHQEPPENIEDAYPGGPHASSTQKQDDAPKAGGQVPGKQVEQQMREKTRAQDMNHKTQDMKQKTQNDDQNKSEMDEMRKKEQQRLAKELMAKKLKEAEGRPVLYKASDDRKPKDCYELYRRAPGQARNGAYKIFVVGLQLYVTVYCDMRARGWTVLLKREDGAVDFYRDWDEYKDGFGAPFGDHYLGNEVLHYLTNQGHYSLKVDLKDWAGESRSANYTHFWLDSEDHGFKLHVLGYSGTAGDGLGKHDGMKFSTKDVDNDLLGTEMGGSCAQRFKGAGWYYKCYMSNLMGVHYVDGTVPEKRFDGIAWKPWKGPSYSLKEVVLKIRPTEAS